MTDSIYEAFKTYSITIYYDNFNFRAIFIKSSIEVFKALKDFSSVSGSEELFILTCRFLILLSSEYYKFYETIIQFMNNFCIIYITNTIMILFQQWKINQ